MSNGEISVQPLSRALKRRKPGRELTGGAWGPSNPILAPKLLAGGRNPALG